MQIRELLNQERNRLIRNHVEDAGIITKILMQFVLKETQSYIVANGEKELDEYKTKEFTGYVDKIIDGTPVQYITNDQEFMKLHFYVDESVLIPQPDTEILVEEVIRICKER